MELFNELNEIKKIKLTLKKEIENKLDISFFKIKEIVFEKEKPSRENFENIFHSLKKLNMNIIYLLSGKKNKIDLYLGIANTDKKNSNFSSDYCFNYLKDIFLGNYQGSRVEEIKKSDVENEILYDLKNIKYLSILRGVPTFESKEKNNFQNIEYLINSMLGTEFQLLINIKPCTDDEVIDYEETLRKKYEEIYKNNNIRTQIQTQSGESKSEDNSNSESTTDSKSENDEKRGGKEERKEKGYSDKEWTTTSENWGKSNTKNFSKDIRKNITKSSSKNNTEIKSYEKIDKRYGDIMGIFDEQIFPKILLGKNRGLFKVQVLASSRNFIFQEKLEGVFLSLTQGKTKNISQTYFEKINDEDIGYINSSFKFYDERKISNEEKGNYFLLSKVVENDTAKTCSYMTVEEISIIAGLPKKEVVGLPINEGVDFGNNIPEIKAENKLKLGKLIQRGTVVKNIISLDKSELNKHIFIAGTTGAGKTTTCHKLLKESEMPFLVIEPAKTEYRELILSDKNINVFTLGREEGIPFRINPFEFLDTENITSHVDMIKASFEASFDMDAAIPQLIEAAIYRCYEEYGWDINDNSNIYLEDRSLAWKSSGIYFPTLSDLLRVVEDVVKDKKMGDRLESEYIGSIKARLEALIVGAKGQMLNTRCSYDFEKLLKNKNILELEEIKSGQDKALIMGFILTRICETLKKLHKKEPSFRHITLIEEAHRLLARAYPGEGVKRQAVEIFADMLAEIRKYGESLIIVDQIPEKLSPEVLKNTNTKIIHKIFSRDDKNVVGDTMSMNEQQKEFLSNLKTGEAIVFSQGWQKAVQVKIDKIEQVIFEEIEKEEKIEKELKKLKEKIYKENLSILYPGLNYIGNINEESKKENLINEYLRFSKSLRRMVFKQSTLKEIYNTYPENSLKNFLIMSIIKKDSEKVIKNNDIKIVIERIWKDIKGISEDTYKGMRLTKEERAKEILKIF